MSRIQVFVPDSHGSFIDKPARDAFLHDLKLLDPFSVIMLGDHVDTGGLFNSHPANYVEEMTYSYEDDCEAANDFLDAIQVAAPRAKIDYMEGNHEAHFARWVARTYKNEKDARAAIEDGAPHVKLRLKKRGIAFHRYNEFHDGLATPGVIKRGNIYVTHGMSACKHAAAAHVDSVGANVVFGHTHRAQVHVRRNLQRGEIMGASPGCLSILQPTYTHTRVTDWSHGYGVAAVDRDSSFMYVNIPIIAGRSKMKLLLHAT